jgi:hypothetical protein
MSLTAHNKPSAKRTLKWPVYMAYKRLRASFTYRKFSPILYKDILEGFKGVIFLSKINYKLRCNYKRS